ncbi:hypothetical protein MFIFM68171_01630 [Madurella fahalii]|uniref:Uncharacterized protein n=1 Tax=Madurella fahalii TaxID=1157608 RepID=A0ABQ0G0Z6_9PEZI
MAGNSMIGRMQNALMSATNEVVLTAANFNFDFSLMKFDAPPEYMGISSAITSSRRQEAEGGEIHITARRLGALFEDVCPATPNLIKAYGTRATELAQQASAQSSLDSSNWIFSAYRGIDATSLWAAATSRKAALPVHLLACLLARVWDGAEAVSLWVEIVAERRKEIAAKFGDGEEIPYSHIWAAVQADISRDQLAKWDASARAWLRTADELKMLQHKQLLLIIKNVTLPVNEESVTYRSIITAWASALETMEKLVAGAPHLVRDGAILLALSSWHLYPDMIVVDGNSGTTVVTLSDPLVHPGGVLTLGISDAGTRASKGVYWSLSLAHHKFYGKPVRKTAQVDESVSRMSLLQLQQATVGAILARWGVPHGDSTVEALRFLLHLGIFMLHDCEPADSSTQWIKMLTVSITEYFKDEEAGASAVMLGRRRDRFIPRRRDGVDRPFFGLLDFDTLLKMMMGIEDRINLLFRIGNRVGNLEDREWLIAYLDGTTWCYMYVFPNLGPDQVIASRKRRRSCRWIPLGFSPSENTGSEPIAKFKKSAIEHTRTRITDKEANKTYVFSFGDEDVAAVFILSDDMSAPITVPEVNYEDMLWAIHHDMIKAITMRNSVFKLLRGKEACPIISCLIQLSLASHAYSNLDADGATISCRVLSSPFVIKALSRLFDINLRPIGENSGNNPWFFDILPDEAEAISIIAYFETGHDFISGLPDETSGRLLGLSVGNSIYVPTRTLSDPHHREGVERPFSRLLGSLGRPGLTLLTCPERPECREQEIYSWRESLVSFDGANEDCFNRTTLHLSLTDWCAPLGSLSAAVGQRDSPGTHIEAVVSVMDAGCWVADVDPLRALKSSNIYQLEPQTSCNHTEAEKRLPKPKMAALEKWDQIMDCDEGLVVTKSHGNWVGRLAIVCVLAQHCRLPELRIVVCPDTVCWQCIHTPATNTVFVY